MHNQKLVYIWSIKNKGVMTLTLKHKKEIIHKSKIDFDILSNYIPEIIDSIALLTSHEEIKRVSGEFTADTGRTIKFTLKR